MAHNPPLILIADDEPDILLLYKTKLVRAGFDVVTASNGVEAIAAAKEKKPDLILMDMKMPVMDGIAAQQQLKDDPETKDLKVVFVTAFSDVSRLDVDQQMAKSSGAVDFIKKGIELNEFVEKVKAHLPAPQGPIS